MSEALEATFKELPASQQNEAMQEVIARRILAAATLGQRDPARLLDAARREGP
jgi:hypothetical protein